MLETKKEQRKELGTTACDVNPVSQPQSSCLIYTRLSVRESVQYRIMPGRCVAGGCSNFPDVQNGVVLHAIPFFDDSRPEAKKRRKKWVDFVKQKRARWEPTRNSSLCSKHFTQEDFMRRFSFIDEESKKPIIPRLKRDDIGINVVPTVHAEALGNSPVLGESAKRRLERVTLKNVKMRMQALEPQPSTSYSSSVSASEEISKVDQPEVQDPTTPQFENSAFAVEIDCVAEHHDPKQKQSTETAAVTQQCAHCGLLSKRNRQLRNQLLTAKLKLKRCRQELRNPKKQENKPGEVAPKSTVVVPSEDGTNKVSDDDDSDDQEDTTEQEPDFSSSYETETETESENEDYLESSDNRVYMTDGNLKTQPKFIVFLSQLLLLFKFCHFCKAENPLVETRQVGTMAVVTSTCTNTNCKKRDTVWKSQPNMPGTKLPAGNFLLCMAILLSGSSASKVLQLFRHMGVACISLNTFFRHQREKLFPTIHLFWKSYQEKLIRRLKEEGHEPLTIAGDGRHDSMGHCAKYGAYTIFCCTLPYIIHFSLVQRNVAGSSPAMEFLGFKNCMGYLFGCGLVISTLITDRHTSIRKYMREQLKDITHYFDLWHLKKKIHKVLTKISKESGCTALINWIRPCENHFFWSATSTLNGNGNVIYAKFKSFLSHVINKHDHLDEPLYERCEHGEIQHRTWLDKDSPVYEKMHSALTNASLVSGIKQVSPEAQTSCLEGFHSTLNQFAPKMISFSFVGMYCRHIIAVLYFNLNLNRDNKKKRADGKTQEKVVWPKFKNGEATVRDVKVEPNYAYVDEIYQAFLDVQGTNKLGVAVQELREMTPLPMNSMLEKQSKEEAIAKRAERKRKTIKDVPPTTPVTEPVIQQQPQTSKGKPRYCSSCKQPMKGHKNVTNCPRNQLQPIT